MINKYPLLVNVTPNMKVTLEEYRILSHCNGFNDLMKIKEKTGLSSLQILLIIKKYAKKGMVRIKYKINK